MSEARRKRVEAMVRAIRDLHRRGRPLRPRDGDTVDPPSGSVADEAQRRGLDVESLRQARRFAKQYTPTKLDALCQFIKNKQSGQDERSSIVGPTHIIRLLSVPGRRRETLLRLAVTGGWSLRELEARIRTEFGSRRLGGRRRLVPTDLPGLLGDVHRQCESWRRWRARLGMPSDANAERTTFDLLPATIRTRVDAASSAVRSLQEAIGVALKKICPNRDKHMEFNDREPVSSGPVGGGSRSGRTTKKLAGGAH
jgi:hypothetical protein